MIATTYTAAEANALIESGKAPDGMRVDGALSWEGSAQPPRLPRHLNCYSLSLAGSPIESLPDGLVVRFKLNLRDCTRLERLPRGLRAGSLDLSGCVSLRELPEDFEASFLDISGCMALRGWPTRANLSVGRLRMRNCLGMHRLPDWLGSLAQLDARGCASLHELPEGLRVSSWIDLGGTGITALPDSLHGVGLRWRGVPVNERVAFRPEEITVAETLAQPNAELRRVMLERMGFDRFLAEAEPELLDVDEDAGGPRRLYRMPLEGDEALVCVSVRCPSTGRHYMIRVPPTMRTCRQAIAWTAGFDDPNDYRPLVET